MPRQLSARPLSYTTLAHQPEGHSRPLAIHTAFTALVRTRGPAVTGISGCWSRRAFLPLGLQLALRSRRTGCGSRPSLVILARRSHRGRREGDAAAARIGLDHVRQNLAWCGSVLRPRRGAERANHARNSEPDETQPIHSFRLECPGWLLTRPWNHTILPSWCASLKGPAVRFV
jgi:hypothetical protein